MDSVLINIDGFVARVHGPKGKEAQTMAKAGKIFDIFWNYNTDRNVQPMGYGYPAFSPTPKGDCE